MDPNNPGRGRGLSAALLMIAIVVATSSMWGCSDELDPQDPEDAYLLYRDAMLAGDAEAVWGRVDEQTHTYFAQSYEKLERMGEAIERYLPQSDHRLARRQSGVVLLEEVGDGRELFLRIFQPQKLPDEEAYRLGSDLETVNLAEDESFARVITRSGQEYYLTRGDEGQWYVMMLKSTQALEESMQWLEANDSALGQTVDDLIDEERKKREAIIAELMDK